MENGAIRDTVLWHDMACMAMVPCLRHCAKDRGPKLSTRGIKEVEKLQEILSDVMLKTSEGELSENLEGL